MLLGEDNLRKALKDFGLTDSEVEIYLFVSKHGVLSGTDIAHLIKKDKAQTFRILKNLQTKGFVEATIEVPARYSPVEFEKVLELTIKAKKDEAAAIEETREQLLNYWKELSKRSLDESLEKFVVVEGRHKVYSKIAQMVASATSDVSLVSTFSGLSKAEQYGVFESLTRKQKNAVHLRLLTESSGHNSAAIKGLLKNLTKHGFIFKARMPDLGLAVFPRMVVKDNREAVFFLTPRTHVSVAEDNMCLWTNSRNLVEAFTFVFEDLWHNSTDLLDETEGVGTGKLQTTQKKYEEIMNSAKNEVLVMTSAKGLIRLWETQPLLKEYAERGVSVKIMAPIMSENYDVAQQILAFGEVRHVSTGNLETAIIDGKHLFQFKTSSEEDKSDTTSYLENAFYSNDFVHVEKTQNILNNLWKNATPPSVSTLKAVLRPPEQQMLLRQMDDESKISGKELTSMTIDLRCMAIIQPPPHLRIPAMVIDVNQAEKQSTFGASVSMMIFLRFQTPSVNASIPVRYQSVPVAIVETNPHPSLTMVWKTLFAGTPAEQNVIVVKPDELELYRRGNTVFAGWTMPIPLPTTGNNLPPSCIMLERYGSLKHFNLAADFPSGYKVKQAMDYQDAFVTYISPLWNYAGSGIEGMVCTNTTRSLYAP